jgi:hypothetical protein
LKNKTNLIASDHFLFSGSCLTDLTFTEDGNPDGVASKNNASIQYINFSKRELICQIVNTVQSYQQMAYQFPPVEPVHTFLRELPSLDEKNLYALSLRLETRKAKSTESIPDPKGKEECEFSPSHTHTHIYRSL